MIESGITRNRALLYSVGFPPPIPHLECKWSLIPVLFPFGSQTIFFMVFSTPSAISPGFMANQVGCLVCISLLSDPFWRCHVVRGCDDESAPLLLCDPHLPTQDNIWGTSLIVAGAFVCFLAWKTGVKYFRMTVVFDSFPWTPRPVRVLTVLCCCNGLRTGHQLHP